VKEILLSTAAEIEKELLTLQELLNEMATIRIRNDIVSKRAKGSILHDFYNCCERIFKKIAIELNSGYGESEKWHKSLLYKMTISIEGIRPRVISDELAADLDEFLAFRHLFRNIYGFELKGGRFEDVAAKFGKEIRDFLDLLGSELE
jgi:hypothetical protein